MQSFPAKTAADFLVLASIAFLESLRFARKFLAENRLKNISQLSGTQLCAQVGDVEFGLLSWN